MKNNQISELIINKKTISSTAGKIVEIYKEINQDNSLFSYNNIRRILFNNDKSEIILKGYNDSLQLIYVNHTKPDLIKLIDIFIIVVKSEQESNFEIILYGNPPPRFIFEVQNKNKILNDIIELLLKYYKSININEHFLLFSYKTSIKRYMRHINLGKYL